MKNRFYHVYKKDFGASQKELVELYLRLGKNVDEIADLLKPIPRASIRGRKSELLSEEKLKQDKYQILTCYFCGQKFENKSESCYYDIGMVRSHMTEKEFRELRT